MHLILGKIWQLVSRSCQEFDPASLILLSSCFSSVLSVILRIPSLFSPNGSIRGCLCKVAPVSLWTCNFLGPDADATWAVTLCWRESRCYTRGLFSTLNEESLFVSASLPAQALICHLPSSASEMLCWNGGGTSSVQQIPRWSSETYIWWNKNRRSAFNDEIPDLTRHGCASCWTTGGIWLFMLRSFRLQTPGTDKTNWLEAHKLEHRNMNGF